MSVQLSYFVVIFHYLTSDLAGFLKIVIFISSCGSIQRVIHNKYKKVVLHLEGVVLGE